MSAMSPKDKNVEKPNRLSRLVFIWMAGTIILLPVKFFNLPLNLEVVDLWILIGLPFLLVLHGLDRHRIVNIVYVIPIWLIIMASLLATFISPSFPSSLTVILKESYLFVWFLAIVIFLSVMTTLELRRVMYVWTAVAVVHGLLVIVQFFVPEVWRFTSSLGGVEVKYEIYRPSGLFISSHAGDANKAAIFQMLGFVPLLLAGFSRRMTYLLGTILFVAILLTGSMGATTATIWGITIAVKAVAFSKRRPSIFVDVFSRILFISLLLGSVFYPIVTLNQRYLDHFQGIIIGRFDRSSGNRVNLWQRGVDVLLEHKSFLWGVGPENFRELDAEQTDNQLHNDFLAFLVERGLIGALGLALFILVAFRSAFFLLKMSALRPDIVPLGRAVFLGAIVALLIESLTHQVFHTRELWLTLAMLEATVYKVMVLMNGNQLPTHSTDLRVQPPGNAKPQTVLSSGK